jgi:hypothetical protein
MMNTRGRLVVAAVLACWAASSQAQISLTAEPGPIGSDEFALRWEADIPGPYDLYRDGALYLSDVASPVTLSLTGEAEGRFIVDYEIQGPAGECSNEAHLRHLDSGRQQNCRVSLLPLDWRHGYRDGAELLERFPRLRLAATYSLVTTEWLSLARLSDGGIAGSNFPLPRGTALQLLTGDWLGEWPPPEPIIVVGASDPSERPLRLPATLDDDHPGAWTLVSIPHRSELYTPDEFLCGEEGVDWDDGGAGPLTCPAGLHQAQVGHSVLSMFNEIPCNYEGRQRIQESDFDPGRATGTLRWRYVDEDAVFVARWGPVDSSDPSDPASTGRPAIDFQPGDAGAPAACRCPDSDGDGDDDCSERLLGSDPSDAGSFGRDIDADGVPDATDACPIDADPGQEDSDGDGRGDACDDCPNDALLACPDRDGDGWRDAADDCPDHPDPRQLDEDLDGTGDACDPCPLVFNPPGSPDADGDGLPDACDDCDDTLDADGDGLGDTCDNCADVPNPDQANEDDDELGDACDACPFVPDTDVDNVCDEDDNCLAAPNPGQADKDVDGWGDACDNCPTEPNPTQWDGDADSIADACDNCPQVFNFLQEDRDGDGVGDLCDPEPDDPDTPVLDTDEDGVRDVDDNCRLLPNDGQADSDGDGVGDACDRCPDLPTGLESDADRDGRGDGCDCAPDDPELLTAPADPSCTGDFDTMAGSWDIRGCLLLQRAPASVELRWPDPAPVHGDATVSDFVRGGLEALWTNGLEPSAQLCLRDRPGGEEMDANPGSAWYLARARNSCGSASYGAGGLLDGPTDPCP